MRNLIIILFATVLMVACSQETSEAASETEATTEMASESTDESAEASSDEVHNPEVEPLPDWDSLPPIEEEEVVEENKKEMLESDT